MFWCLFHSFKHFLALKSSFLGLKFVLTHLHRLHSHGKKEYNQAFQEPQEAEEAQELSLVSLLKQQKRLLFTPGGKNAENISRNLESTLSKTK